MREWVTGPLRFTPTGPFLFHAICGAAIYRLTAFGEKSDVLPLDRYFTGR
jgi:hypothetical protein